MCEVTGRVKIESVLACMGEDTLRDVFLSRACVETLKALDPAAVEPGRLRRIVLEKVPPSSMLRDRAKRAALITALRRTAIGALAGELRVRDSGGADMYGRIGRMAFRRNSGSERALFRFFETEPEEGGDGAESAAASAGAAPTVVASPARPLFDHQVAAVSEIRRRLGRPGSRTLLHMPTGAGKTRIAMRYVADTLLGDPRALVVWLAYSEELCEQAVEEFAATWSGAGNRDVEIHRFYGGHNPDLLSGDRRAGLVVAGLSKMFRRARAHDLFLTTLADRASLVVMDEAHQAVAETYAFVLGSLVEKHGVRLLGLSATPGRTWNDRSEDERLARFFSRSKVTLDSSSPIDFLADRGFIARPSIERLSHADSLTADDARQAGGGGPGGGGGDIPQAVLDKLAGDVARNVRIVSRLEGMIAEGHARIMYFATSVSNARDISMALHARGHDSYHVDAATPGAARRRIIGEYRSAAPPPKIICNFGVLTAGFDAPGTTAVLIARPTRSLILYSQMAGRAMRGPSAGGSKECTISTVVDTSLPGFGSIAGAFGNWEDVWA